jgi:hypothetical protein
MSPSLSEETKIMPKAKEKFDVEEYERRCGVDARPMTEDPAPQPKYGVGGRKDDQPKKKRK